MKLLPISNKCVFHGLWGDVRTEISGNEYYSTIQNTIQYHPFKEESLTETNIITGNKWKQPRFLDDITGILLYDKDIVEVGGRLHFTKEEYYKYKNKLLSSEKIKSIEKCLKEFKLLEYLNDYKDRQNNFGTVAKIKKFLKIL